jgi:Uma2 family endonuclease
MTAPSTPLHGLTWQEFLDLPEDPALRHAELINGEVVVTAPSDLHQQVVGFLITHLNIWIWDGADRGEATMDPAVQIANDRGHLPDIAWYHQEQCAPSGERRAFDGPPSLVVEVLSPSTRTLDMVRKRNDYGRIGVRELWLIDPEIPQALIACAPEGRSDLIDVADIDRDGELRSTHLPGFAVRLGDLVER